MKTTLRLLFTENCNRSCPGCCNKQWDLNTIPVVEHFNYEEIMLTGGEPLLYLDQLIGVIRTIRALSKAKIYVYTAFTPARAKYFANKAIYFIIEYVDGITLTMHDQQDADDFAYLLHTLETDEETRNSFMGKSLRLNVFKDIILPQNYESLNMWTIKSDIEWIENCPLPENEEFRRL